MAPRVPSARERARREPGASLDDYEVQFLRPCSERVPRGVRRAVDPGRALGRGCSSELGRSASARRARSRSRSGHFARAHSAHRSIAVQRMGVRRPPRDDRARPGPLRWSRLVARGHEPARVRHQRRVERGGRRRGHATRSSGWSRAGGSIADARSGSPSSRCRSPAASEMRSPSGSTTRTRSGSEPSTPWSRRANGRSRSRGRRPRRTTAKCRFHRGRPPRGA
jgi:hypothetical protein